jgi:hypothetical protein
MFARGLLIIVGLATACTCRPPPSKRHASTNPSPADAWSASGTADARDASWNALPAPGRIVAIGDLHGDLATSRAALRLAGAIDATDRWIGGELWVVQLGDRLDRGDEDRQVLELFDRLAEQAPASGGRVLPLLGNHETMNVDGSMGYVTEGGYRAFDDLPGLDLTAPELQQYPEGERARRAAFAPGGPFARRLTRREVVVQIGDSVFVHGGVLPAHVDYGLARINDETRRWIAGDAPRPLHVRDGPLWTNVYGSGSVDPATCALLDQVLAALGARRMVVAHVVQAEGINAACDGRVWRIDVGLARYYGGPLEVLEIAGDEARRLTPPSSANE